MVKYSIHQVNRNNVTEEEVKTWLNISAKMYLPYDEELDIIVQHDDFLDKEFIKVKDLPKCNLPLNQNWSWDKILRSCFIKQADVLQGIYYFSDKFTFDEKKRNFDFYETYTVHESSLSPSIYSIIACEIDNLDKAYELYSRTARLDLDNYNNDTELFEVVKKLYKEAYGCVKLIYIDINDKYKYQLTEEEMTYLIIHIQSITEKSVCKTYN